MQAPWNTHGVPCIHTSPRDPLIRVASPLVKKRLSLLTAAESVSLTSRTCNSEGRRGVDVGRTSASGERGEGNYRFWPVQCKDKCGKHACPRPVLPYFWLRMHVIKQAIKAYNYNQLGTAISWLNFRARLI